MDKRGRKVKKADRDKFISGLYELEKGEKEQEEGEYVLTPLFPITTNIRM